MEEIFINHIRLNDVRNVKNFEIALSKKNRKNLIITGKNGSGKTTLLSELLKYLKNIPNKAINNRDNAISQVNRLKIDLAQQSKSIEINIDNFSNTTSSLKDLENWLKKFGGIDLYFNSSSTSITNCYDDGDFIIAFFEAKRKSTLKAPTGINRVDLKSVYGIDEKAGKDFIQYIVNLKADRSFARDENDNVTADKIDTWFKNFETNLFNLFEVEDIKLVFDRKLYNFNIIENGKEPYNLNQLSDGFSAILDIVTELIMRMEEHSSKNYDLQGVVLIDEIETHLHVELQKKVLPFLTSFFPRIQFIVTTHSPFVLSSIENAVICDLEKRIVTEDFSGYSYDTIIESYFDSDKYSDVLKKKIEQYETLNLKQKLNDKEIENLHNLKKYFNEIPKFISDELAVKLQQIRLKDIKKKDS